MKVKFVVSCEIEVFDSFDEITEDLDGTREVFIPGNVVEFDIIDHPQKFEGNKLVDATEYVNVQFGNGSVATGISVSWYEVIGE